MERSDKQSIIQLASKYRFHPMFITDTIEMGHQQAKLRIDNGVFFCYISAFAIDQKGSQVHATTRKLLNKK